MKKILAVALIFSLAFVAASPAQAHVLITDQTGKNGAVLHMTPDDDPIAGQETVLFLDMQSVLAGGLVDVGLTVRNDAGVEEEVETEVSGTLVTAAYTFPAQGVYELKYEVNTSSGQSVFEESKRVSRGVAGNAADRQTYVWAEGALILSIVGLAMLLILGFNRRQAIVKQSKL